MGVMPWADNGGGEWSEYYNIDPGLQCIWNMDGCKPSFASEDPTFLA